MTDLHVEREVIGNTRPEVVENTRRWISEVFNDHRLDQVETLKVAEYVDWNPFPGQDVALSGFKGVLEEFLHAFPDFNYQVTEEIFEGDIAICVGKWTGTMSQDFMGLPPSGATMGARRADIMRFNGPMMTERWGVGNELQMLRFLGMADAVAPVDPGFAGVVETFIREVLGNHSLGTVDALVEQDATSWAIGSLRHALICAALDDLTITVTEVRAQEGDEPTASADVLISGRHARELWGVPATGEMVQVPATLRFRGQGQQITHLRIEHDLDQLAEQLGPVTPGTPRNTAPTGTGGDARFVLRAFVLDVLNRRDLGAITDLVDESAEDLLQETLTLNALLQAIPMYQFNIERVIAAGDRVSLLATFGGQHERPLLGKDSIGRGALTRTISVLGVENGRITDALYSFDLYSLLSRLGLFPEDAFPGQAS